MGRTRTSRSRGAAAILVAAGRGSRFRGYKQFAWLEGRSVLSRSLATLQEAPSVDQVVLVLPAGMAEREWGEVLESLRPDKLLAVGAGGRHRVDSVRAGLAMLDWLARPPEIVVVHDAARPLTTTDLIDATVRAARRHGAAVAAAPATDTVKHAPRSPIVSRTIPRDEVFLAQTPQAFRRRVLQEVLDDPRSSSDSVTDEASLVELRDDVEVAVVPAPRNNIKITEEADLDVATTLLRRETGARPTFRVGHGFDLHRLVSGRPLWLGGVRIPCRMGLLGHSDGDVILHALCDALLGAAGEAADLGSLFPDTDPEWKGAASPRFLSEAVRRIRGRGFSVMNVDLTVHAERPKLSPHYAEVRASVARMLGVEPDRVGLKAKTHEGLGDIGRGRAMAATAVVMLAAQG